MSWSQWFTLFGLLSLLVLVGWGWRSWRRGKARLAASAQQLREAEAARLRRKERRKQREAEGAITPVSPSDGRHQGRRSVILVVDDSELVRHTLRRTLEEHDYRVITAEDGRQAWNVLQEPEKRPDLIITDIQMPRVTGLQLLRLIREDMDLAGVPVLLLTGKEEYTIPQAQQEGANGFIRKPTGVNQERGYLDEGLLDQVRFALQD